jgi:hypothetical protein
VLYYSPLFQLKSLLVQQSQLQSIAQLAQALKIVMPAKIVNTVRIVLRMEESVGFVNKFINLQYISWKVNYYLAFLVVFVIDYNYLVCISFI